MRYSRRANSLLDRKMAISPLFTSNDWVFIVRSDTTRVVLSVLFGRLILASISSNENGFVR